MDKFLQSKILSGTDVDRGRGIWVSIGWKEFEPYLIALKTNEPQENLDELLKISIGQVQAATRQYARRQTVWIRGKLINALAENNSLARLFLVDSTNVSEWPTSVRDPAMKITENFLAGEQLPAPPELSDTAKAVLTTKKSYESEIKVQRLCETCWMNTYTETEWHAHLKSRGHRARVKRSLKKSGSWKHGVAQTSELPETS